MGDRVKRAACRGAPPLLWRGMCAIGSAHCHVTFLVLQTNSGWQGKALALYLPACSWLYISCSLSIALMADDSSSGTPPGTEDAATLSEAALRDIVRREVSAAVPEALRSGPSPGGLPIAGQWQYYSGISQVFIRG